MLSPWNQKSIFPKPANSVLVQVNRVICRALDDVYAVHWFHLYENQKKQLLGFETKTQTTIIEGQTVDSFNRQFYTESELSEIESSVAFADNSKSVQVMSEFSFSNTQEADSYIDEWLYDVCKCDGGFSSYAQRTVNRRSKTARREAVQPQMLIEKRA